MTEARPELDEAIADVEQQLGQMFGRVRAIWREAAAQIHPDLQPIGYKLLGAIVRSGETNAHALAEALEVDKSIVSRKVKLLEEAGLVTSHADAKDGRARVLTPTPLAIERLRTVRAAQHERLRERLQGRSADDIREFAGMLRLLGEG